MPETDLAALPPEARQFFDEGGAVVNRLVEIVEKLDEPLPTLIDAIDGLGRDDLRTAVLVAVLGIVGFRAEKAKPTEETA